MRRPPCRILDAALAADPLLLREAIEAGEDINGRDEVGLTPLLSAVFVGDLEAVRLLLSAGANPNIPGRDDPTATPFWHARHDFGLHEIAELLVKAGAKDEQSA